jgi:membrane protease YdiL (CAAX protease family)
LSVVAANSSQKSNATKLLFLKNNPYTVLMKYRYIYAIIIIGILYFIEQHLPIAYVYKAGIKIVLFLSPLLLFSEYIKLKKTSQTRLAYILSIAFFSIIISCYYIVQSQVDLNLIVISLARQEITAKVFIITAIYILVGNAFIEEYFFRGFLKDAPIISSLLFALYHITIFLTWFTPTLFLLALAGLFLAGLIFHKVNNKQTLLNGLIVHIGADIGLILIGLFMFGFF